MQLVRPTSTRIRLIRVALLVTVAIGLGAFLFAAYIGSTIWWLNHSPWNSTGKGAQFMLIPYKALVKRQPKVKPTGYATPTLMPSYYTFRLFMYYAGIAVAASATFCLCALRQRYQQPTRSALSKKVRQILSYQLPPRQYLLWWCGGVSVIDLAVYLSMWALVIVWIQQLVQLRYEAMDALIQKGPAAFAAKYPGMTVHQARQWEWADRCGFGGVAGILIIFLPVPRNSFLQALFGVDFSHMIKYHRWAGHITLIAVSVHGLSWFTLWGLWHEFRPEFSQWAYNNVPHLAGPIAWFFGLILWVTSISYMRRHMFNVFYKFHIICWVMFYVFASIHCKQITYYSSPGILLYLLDLTYRLAQWMNVSIVTGSILSNDTLSLTLSFAQDTKLVPNSFVFLSIPAASRAQYHPFTLAYVRNSQDGHTPAQATIHMKPYGRWSQRLAREIANHGSALVKVDGPYSGCTPLLTGEVEVAVIFAGGIEVTPMLGVLDSLCHSHADMSASKPPQKVVFVWVTCSTEDFQLMNQWLQAKSRVQDSWLDVRLYCTEREGEPASYLPAKGDTKEAVLKLDSEAMQQINKDGPVLEEPFLGQKRYSLASPFFLKPSLLQGYGIGHLTWALAHWLCFAGAFFTTIVIEVTNSVGMFSSKLGFPFWLIDFMRMVALFVGGMGCPALLVFPLYLHKRRQAERAAVRRGKTAADSSVRVSNGEHSSTADSSNKGNDVEAASQLKYTPGRPDMQEILAETIGNHTSPAVIHVHAAGPVTMVNEVRYLCATMSSQGKGPQLQCIVNSFVL